MTDLYMDCPEFEIESEKSGRPGVAAFLMTAKDKLTGEAYEKMLRRNGVGVTSEPCEPIGLYAAVYGTGSRPDSSVNLYVRPDQLELARALVDEFENMPIVYKTPPPVLNQKSRTGQAAFLFVLFLIFAVPLAISVYVVGARIASFFIR